MLKLFLDAPYCHEESVKRRIPVLPFARCALRGSAEDEAYTFFRVELFERMSRQRHYEIAETASAADAILMPVDWSLAHRLAPRIELHYREVAARTGRPLIFTHFADNTADVPGDNVIVLRHSKYRSTLRANEIVCPPAVADISAEVETGVLPKPQRPTVGFVGISKKSPSLNRLRRAFKYSKRDYLSLALGPVMPSLGPQRSGMYYRTRAMEVLARTPGVACDFVQRDFWGRGPQARHQEDPKRVRREFTDNMARNLYLLSVRGMGNYSFRFFEILSAGRIPLLIDTDSPLPLEDEIDYRKFCIVVDWRDLRHAGRILLDHHAAADAETIADMQTRAHAAFRERLDFEVFCQELFRERLPRMLQSRIAVAG